METNPNNSSYQASSSGSLQKATRVSPGLLPQCRPSSCCSQVGFDIQKVERLTQLKGQRFNVQCQSLTRRIFIPEICFLTCICLLQQDKKMCLPGRSLTQNSASVLKMLSFQGNFNCSLALQLKERHLSLMKSRKSWHLLVRAHSDNEQERI